MSKTGPTTSAAAPQPCNPVPLRVDDFSASGMDSFLADLSLAPHTVQVSQVAQNKISAANKSSAKPPMVDCRTTAEKKIAGDKHAHGGNCGSCGNSPECRCKSFTVPSYERFDRCRPQPLCPDRPQVCHKLTHAVPIYQELTRISVSVRDDMNGCGTCGSHTDGCGCKSFIVPSYERFDRCRPQPLCPDRAQVCRKLVRPALASSEVPEASLSPPLHPPPTFAATPGRIPTHISGIGALNASALTKGETRTYLVSVGPKGGHQWAGDHKGELAIYLQDANKNAPPTPGPTLKMVRGNTYIFRLGDMKGHTFMLTTSAVGGATAVPAIKGAVAAQGQELSLQVDKDLPSVLTYQSSLAPLMGGYISVHQHNSGSKSTGRRV